ncbi:MAG: ATP-grasp domain-containing protein [Acidobacteria bacterium]|nr:ATP-grasp domain-containing protein [Acidobacteriota bacterium]
MQRVLLLVPTTTYRVGAFLAAARRLGVDVVVGSDQRQVFESAVPDLMLTLDFRNVRGAVTEIERYAGRHPLNAVIGADDETMHLASEVAQVLGLRGSPPAAVEATRNKFRLRQILEAAGVPAPWHRLIGVEEDPVAAARAIEFPCVLKPTFLAASRGVIRADDPGQFAAAHKRIAALLSDPKLQEYGGPEARHLLVEEYLPGSEYAVEGLLSNGDLQVLAIFDKPDPLEGPYFEETLYVTPSRAPQEVSDRLVEQVERALKVIGLTEGPVHAELRVGPGGAYLIDLAARAIGGRCSGVLRFSDNTSLEELILRQALGERVDGYECERVGAGVMMIPIPRTGVLREVHGVEAARAVEWIVSLELLLGKGQKVTALPEGYQYLGFIFARAPTAGAAEAALRKAHQCLGLEIVPG